MSPVAPKRFDVILATLDPTVGSEIRKTRPCVVVSPDIINTRLRTVIIAPLTSSIRRYPSRIATRFAGIDGEVALDQIRSVDKSRLVKQLGVLSDRDQPAVLNCLAEMFAW